MLPIKCLIVLFSYHHKNTEKIAQVIAKVLNAEIEAPKQVDPNEHQNFDLVGFGSGIYSNKHHKSLLNLADSIPHVANRKAFIFSTSAMMGKDKVTNDHSMLREKLQLKGCQQLPFL